MLQRLLIKNIVLIEECEICFSDKFNVLTGETGSGKSVILSALSFLMGEKIDTSMIRKEKDECYVEAIFSPKQSTELNMYLETIGISKEPDEDIAISRKLLTTGKAKNFINNQSVQVGALKKVFSYLVESCSQHAHLELLKNHMPTIYYDDYINAEGIRREFQKAQEIENRYQNDLKILLQNENERFRTIDNLKREIQEIDSLDLQEAEDEELFNSIEQFYRQKENYDTISEILTHLDADENGILAKLHALKGRFEKLSEQDANHKEVRNTFLESINSLKEIVFHLTKSSNIETQESVITEKEKRLKKIEELKKKYGNTIDEILQWKRMQSERLESLIDIDMTISQLRIQIKDAKDMTDKLAKTLSDTRNKSIESFSNAMTQELRALNLPKAHFDVEMIKNKRSELGDEYIRFFLIPNQGEKRIDIQEHASGGELSRIALCLQKLLTHKNATPTLLFDEIDANVGGTTANEIAKKLVAISETKQIICITHFPQVAKMANAHFRISKCEKDNRTLSTVEFLSEKKSIQDELNRMIGTTSI